MLIIVFKGGYRQIPFIFYSKSKWLTTIDVNELDLLNINDKISNINLLQLPMK